METAQCTMHCAVWSRLSLLRSRVRFLTSIEEFNHQKWKRRSARCIAPFGLAFLSCDLVCVFLSSIDVILNNGNGAVHDALRLWVSAFLSCDLLCVFLSSINVILNNGDGAVHDALRRLVSAILSCDLVLRFS